MSDMYEIEVKIEAATIQNWFMIVGRSQTTMLTIRGG